MCRFALPGRVAELSQISVKGNQFVTADGKPIVFRGLDTSDPEKLERNGQWNRDYFAVAKSWGANIVRFPVHPAAWRMRGKDSYIQLLDQGVGWAGELGLYVIIDWHSMGNLCSELFARLLRTLSARAVQHDQEGNAAVLEHHGPALCRQ